MSKMSSCSASGVCGFILLVSMHSTLPIDAAKGILKRQVLTVYSGLGIQNHFDKYYGSIDNHTGRTGYVEWERLQSLNYRDRNVLCLVAFKATNHTTDLKFRTTKSAKSVLPYDLHGQNRTLFINVSKCSVSTFECTTNGTRVEVPWYDFYLAQAEKYHCVYRFSFPYVDGREEIVLVDSGIHALKMICEIDFSEYTIW